ncbi:hypothetical protein [Micromonospora echinospora]|uniref:hypothetical protein n=1 Tax=Micromonospora echinospora TaxID=1877 RepID=UPI003A8A3884
MPRRSAGWIWAGRVVAGLTVAGLVVYLAVVGLDRADKIGSAAGVVVAVLGLVAPYLLPPRRQSPAEGDSPAPEAGSPRRRVASTPMAARACRSIWPAPTPRTTRSGPGDDRPAR